MQYKDWIIFHWLVWGQDLGFVCVTLSPLTNATPGIDRVAGPHAIDKSTRERSWPYRSGWHRWGGSNGVTSWIPPVSAWVCGYSFLQYCENHDVFGSHSICHYIWWSSYQHVHVLQPYRPRAKNHTLYHRRGLVVAICKCGRRHPGRLNVSHAYTGSFLHTMHLEFCEIYTYIAPKYIAPKSYRG